MRNIYKVMFAVAVLFAARPAKADLYLEPYLGYHLGTMESTYKSGAKDSWMMGMTAIGARVGLSLPIFFIAADYSLGSGGKATVKDNGSGSATSGDVSSQQLFAVVGARIPLLRAYAGYGLINDVTVKDSSGEGTFKGNAMKLGVGYSGLPFVAINFEYIMSTFNKIKTSAGEFDLSATNLDKATATTYMVNVSLPLSF